MNKDSLGDRMKGYENISRIYLKTKSPVILRLDGKAFHSFTHGFARPFDDILITSMQETAKYLCENIMGCKLAYTQSDEISLLLTDYDKPETQAWFNNNLQKMVSIAASMATMKFNKLFAKCVNHYWFDQHYNINECHEYHDKLQNSLNKGAMFDARAFILPKEEVCNYFIWRQQDAIRNSIQMVSQSYFPYKELHGKSCNRLQNMLHEQKDINWNDYHTMYKRGSCIIKESYDIENAIRTRWVIDKEIPVFAQDRNYIDRYVMLEAAK